MGLYEINGMKKGGQKWQMNDGKRENRAIRPQEFLSLFLTGKHFRRNYFFKKWFFSYSSHLSSPTLYATLHRYSLRQLTQTIISNILALTHSRFFNPIEKMRKKNITPKNCFTCLLLIFLLNHLSPPPQQYGICVVTISAN